MTWTPYIETIHKSEIKQQAAQDIGHQDILSRSVSDVNGDKDGVGCTFLVKTGIKSKSPNEISWSKVKYLKMFTCSTRHTIYCLNVYQKSAV